MLPLGSIAFNCELDRPSESRKQDSPAGGFYICQFRLRAPCAQERVNRSRCIAQMAQLILNADARGLRKNSQAYRSKPAQRGMSMQAWFLAQVKPNADQIATRNLERQGFTTFQPMERRTMVRRGKFIEQLRPFFSGYLFVAHPSASPPWWLVNSTYGVSRLVKTGDRPAPVPGQVVASLLEACDADGVVRAAPAVFVGDKVEVIRGALTNFVGQVQRLTPDERAIVLLDIMGKQTKVMVPTAFLRAASGRTKQSG